VKGLGFHWFRSSRTVLVEERDIRYMQVSYLTALEKYQEEGHQIVNAYGTYIVAIPDIRTGVIVVQWVCLHLYQEGSNSYSEWEATLVSFKMHNLYSNPIRKQEISTMKQTVKITFTG
jgi:hypothetical protein